MLSIHRSIHEALQGLGASLWPYYKPDSILPHCTVSMGTTDVSTTVEAVAHVGLPIDAGWPNTRDQVTGAFWRGGRGVSSVVETRLQDDQILAIDQIHQSMFVGDAP